MGKVTHQSVDSDLKGYANIKTGLEKLNEVESQLADIASIPSSEDSSALQAAISKGGKVRLKRGKTYIVNTALVIPDSTELDGNFATIKRADGAKIILLSMGANCVIKNLVINGNKDTLVSPTWDTCIEIATGLNAIVENVVINNGNEGIVSYYDNVAIRDCKLTNMGGNGIHFSGSNYTNVNHCIVKNTNLKSGMGHEDGCIIWSNSCQNINCTNNYVENGISGFGSIDSIDNSDVTLANNTIKNMRSYAVEMNLPNTGVRNVVITGNRIYNSIQVQMQNTNASPTDTLENAIFSNNILIDTALYLDKVNKVLLTGNIIKYTTLDTVQNRTGINFTTCKDIVCTNNYIENCKNGVYMFGSYPFILSNNIMKNFYGYGINCAYALNVEVTNNQFINDSSILVGQTSIIPISLGKNCIAANNTIDMNVAKFGIEMHAQGSFAFQNRIKTPATYPSIKVYGGSTGNVYSLNVWDVAPSDSAGTSQNLNNFTANA